MTEQEQQERREKIKAKLQALMDEDRFIIQAAVTDMEQVNRKGIITLEAVLGLNIVLLPLSINTEEGDKDNAY